MSRSVVQITVLVLASKRLTRLVTTDWLGEWALVRPAKKWAYDREGAVDVHLETVITEEGQLVDPTKGFWRTKLISGLDCQWCVGFWTSALVIAPLPSRLDRARASLLTVLAVSQAVGMLAELEKIKIASVDETLYIELEDDAP